MGAAVVGFRTLVPGASLPLGGVGGLVVGAVTFVVAAVLLGSEEIRALPGLFLGRE